MNEGRKIQIDVDNSKKEIYDFLVIDRSGSMQKIWVNTINGINAYLEGLKEDEKNTGIKTYVSLLFFDNRNQNVEMYKNVPVAEVAALSPTDPQIVPRGMTALNDAIGQAITTLRAKLEGREDADDVDVTLSIFTDGGENDSDPKGEWNNNTKLNGHIEELKGLGWTITFTGAGGLEETQAVAANYGIAASNVMNYSADAVGSAEAFGALRSARMTKSMAYSTGEKMSANYFVQLNTEPQQATSEIKAKSKTAKPN